MKRVTNGPISMVLVLLLLFAAAGTGLALPGKGSSSAGYGAGGVNSNSVLVALLDSHYTELVELVEKALLLHTLEEAVGHHNITIFAPRNEALERDLDPEFKRFLLEPRNLRSLQTLLLSHVVPRRIDSRSWPPEVHSAHHASLSGDRVRIHRTGGRPGVDLAAVVHCDAVTRPDGVIHGISRLLVPRSVQEDFNRRRSLTSIAAVHPEGAPSVDTRRRKMSSTSSSPAPATAVKASAKSPARNLPPISDAIAPSPLLAPAPAPGPGDGGKRRHIDGEKQVKDFIQTLLLYGGYNEMADILVNLTSLATEMGRLVSEGYVLTVLAPNDEAMGRLTADQLSEPGAPEEIVYYHMIPEYQTEESMYNAVRRLGKVRYDTLRVPFKMVAEEVDGTVKFGEGVDGAYLYDPDLFVDGRISVQGIDRVLFASSAEDNKSKKHNVSTTTAQLKVASKPRRGKLLETTCRMLGSFGFCS